MKTKMIPIEIAYATKQEQKILTLFVAENTTMLEAILQSQILDLFPQIDVQHLQVGIWGQSKPLNTLVSAGDRVEIYRPLLIDPKQARLMRAKL